MENDSTNLESILYFLDSTLGIPDFPDYANALNGLQVESAGPVKTIGAAVDASLPAIEAAVAAEVDLLVVHHGAYWAGLQPLLGTQYQRIGALIRGGTGLYAAHLPLDAHPELGNSAQLIEALALERGEGFGRFGDRHIGFSTVTDESREEFRKRVEEAVGGTARLIPGGPERIRKVGVVTGGGGSFVRAAAESGLDTLLTGEVSHHHALDAMELGLNVILGGHYATETFGVRALARAVATEFGVEWRFLDFPSGF
jgi:dinuclear metal center YbgI/SA1388 family protein